MKYYLEKATSVVGVRVVNGVLGDLNVGPHVREYRVPDRDSVLSIQPGEHVQVSFKSICGHQIEKMWLRVTRPATMTEPGEGRLDNDPQTFHNLHYGDLISYDVDNVIKIMKGQ